MLGAYQDSRPAPGGKAKVNFGMKEPANPGSSHAFAGLLRALRVHGHGYAGAADLTLYLPGDRLAHHLGRFPHTNE